MTPQTLIPWLILVVTVVSILRSSVRSRGMTRISRHDTHLVLFYNKHWRQVVAFDNKPRPSLPNTDNRRCGKQNYFVSYTNHPPIKKSTSYWIGPITFSITKVAV